MSFTKRIEKKKAQDEMRKLLSERKKKVVKPIKIDNPLAKYNNAGQLMCILCSSIVRSENIWQVHVNSNQHKENVDKAKSLKELTNNFTVGKIKHKNLSSPEDAPPEKKLKGILKNSFPQPVSVQKSENNVPQIVSHHDEQIKRAPLNMVQVKEVNESTSEVTKQELKGKEVTSDVPIPEGFFDDPILDAKVRNIEYKDPIEEEWEKFQKEIKDEASASAEIIAEEREEATTERQIDEIDEQIRNWSRVLDLELKKEETKNKVQDAEQMNIDEDCESDNDNDIDEFLDWRAKKSFT